VLAAGASRRLGRPKQLVHWQGTTLLRRAAETALAARLGPVVVVLGAELEGCRRELDGLDVRIVEHPGWAEGMGSTIRAAWVAAQAAQAGGLLLMTCDQPGVSSGDLRALAEAQRRTGRPMAAAGYSGTAGIPALFTGAAFEQLGTLSGDHGAKSLLERDPSQVAVVPCEAAARDVNAPQDIL
jgi:molybdenum cofactor cytidylyltransferase